VLSAAKTSVGRTRMTRAMAIAAGQRLGLGPLAAVRFGEALAHLITGRPGIQTSDASREPLYAAFWVASGLRGHRLFRDPLPERYVNSPALISGVAAMFRAAKY
jgi:hypothetical protein